MNNTILNWKEHILLRPDVYVGSNDILETKIFVMKDDKIIIVKEFVNRALLHCIREILYNALDHRWRSKTKTEISVEFDGEIFTIRNTGDPISLDKEVFTHVDSETHEVKRQELYFPEAYFGFYCTGSNYDDTKEIKTSGKNGMGAKIVNVLSKLFYVECCDGNKVYKQSYINKYSEKTEPEISISPSEPYVRISFVPDYKEFFKWKDNNIIDGYLKKLCYDCAVVSRYPVYYNKIQVPIKDYKSYLQLYNIEIVNEIEISKNDIHVVFLEVQKGSILNISFVNGNFVTLGDHIKIVRNTTLRAICEYLNKEFDIPDENKLNIKNINHNFFFYITIFKKGLQYTSQTKEEVATKIEYEFKITKSMESVIKKWKLYSNVYDMIVAKIKKTFNPYKLIKLEDANLAGKDSLSCTLFITEGLSAKAFAVEGITVLGGRDKYGVFPIKGKFLNVTKASDMKVLMNKEVISLQTVLGIEKGKDYNTEENRRKLRYGKVDLLTDNDSDGKHIKGLLLNFFHYINRSLFDIGFVQCTNTPILRIYTSETKFTNLYTIPSFEGINGKVKYYKGLGSHSSGKEIEDVFSNQMITKFKLSDDCNRIFDVMFATGYESDRKEIIIEAIARGTNVAPVSEKSCTEFLMNEFVDFQKDTLKRNIPDFIDGLKEAQRKVLYTLLEMPKKEVNVSKLSGIVSQRTNYHHGNEPLESVIVNLAQNFCGANNIPLLEPIGQFGTRNDNGKDASAGRYISVKLNNYFRKCYCIESMLEYSEAEGEKVEPVRFFPPIPYYVINGCDNISPGFRSFIPPYNIKDVIEDIMNILDNKERKELIPFYKGYKGDITMTSTDEFIMEGICFPESSKVTRVAEIPVTTSFSDYKQMLKEYESQKRISNLKDYSTGNDIDLRFKNISLEIEDLKLTKVFHLNNLFVLKDDIPVKYKTISDLLKDFVDTMKYTLETRKKLELETLNKEISLLSQKVKFIKDVRTDQIDIKQHTEDIINRLKELEYIDLGNNFSYLTSLHISSIFKNSIESLETHLATKKFEYDTIQNKNPVETYKETLKWIEN